MSSAKTPRSEFRSSRGKPKGDKRDRTRAALLEAASEPAGVVYIADP